MKNALIIERPELQSMTQRYGWKSVTFFFWYVLYLLVGAVDYPSRLVGWRKAFPYQYDRVQWL